VKILYLGLPLGAVWLARHGLAPAAVLLGHPEAPGSRRLRRVLPPSTLVLGRPRLDDPRIVDLLASTKPDVLLSFFWPKRIPTTVLALPRLGAFGTHPSLLPRHRGPDPYFWTIRNGDETTGVTLHRLDADYDTGAIIDTRTIPVSDELDSWTLARALDRPALELLVDVVRRLERGESLDGAAQDDSRATHAPEPSDEDFSIDWEEDVESILRLVRASAPTPGALADVEGETVEVTRASRYDGDAPKALAVAEAFIVDASVVVRAHDGCVRLDSARDEDGQSVDLVALVAGAQRAREDGSQAP